MLSSLVTIIIPTYNAESTILECISSVLNQTYKNIEVIVVNDGSTDRTSLLLNYFCDGRLRVINQLNSGSSAAKNTGLDQAKGEFIQYLDSDDILSHDKIEKQVNALIGKTNSIAVCRTVIFDKNINDYTSEINTNIINSNHSGIQFYKNLLGYNGNFAMVQPNAYFVPIDIIRKVGPWLTYFYPCPDEDGEYFSRILLSSQQVIFTEGVNYYRKNLLKTSLSNTYSLNRAMNQLKSVEKKCLNLLAIENTSITRKLLLYNISQVVYQFAPQYPELLCFAEEIINKHGFKYFKILNNRKFNLFCILLPMSFFLKLLALYRKLRI